MVRLYPLDVERLPWDPIAEGAAARMLALDAASGSCTRLVRAAAGASLPVPHSDAWEEVYLLAGTAVLDDREYGRGSYLCLPPGTRSGALTGAGEDGFEAVRLEDHHSARMDKPHVRLTSEEVAALEPESAVSGVGGVQYTLAAGPSGSHTRLLEVAPQDDCGLLVHEFAEEGLILAGSYKMSWQLGEELHPAGTYTHLPPHTYHGPFLTNEGYRCFEVRNYA